jgi:DNA-binding beta-propeller fold protein YncE
VAAFDASTMELVKTVPLEAPASDVAVGRFGKVFVGEEGINQIAVIKAATGERVGEITTASRPHHLEASRNGRWITYGAYGTNRVGVIDARTGQLVGEWAASEHAAARSHASVITANGRTVYVANDTTSEVTEIDVRTGQLVLPSIAVPHAHELILTRDQRTMYVVGRTADMLHVVDLRTRTMTDEMLMIGPMPDTLQLVDHDRTITVGLRGTPAQILTVGTDPLEVDGEPITIGGAGTVAGHQWTSPNGRWTLAAFEGGTTPGLARIDHRTGEIVTAEFPRSATSPELPSRPHGLDVER